MDNASFLLRSLPGLAGVSPPRAKRFIVTIYGDVVEPRGGALWMGSLIDVCAAHGISESLVRTAVSRLVASGHLEGERVGRRSYYRLTPEARDEFTQAARLFYGPQDPPSGWRLALDRAEPPGPDWVAFAPRQFIAPALPGLRDDGGAAAVTVSGDAQGDIAGFAGGHWPLADIAKAYERFLRLAQPLREVLTNGNSLSPADALTARLYLVHRFRLAVLADPRLPRNALPSDWPAFAARACFSEIYLRLVQASEAQITTLEGAGGALPASTADSAHRQSLLLQVAQNAAVGG